jgi:hypothetical protein
MDKVEAARFLLACRTALSLLELVHDALWTLYPDELLALSQESETELLELLAAANRSQRDDA